MNDLTPEEAAIAKAEGISILRSNPDILLELPSSQLGAMLAQPFIEEKARKKALEEAKEVEDEAFTRL